MGYASTVLMVVDSDLLTGFLTGAPRSEYPYLTPSISRSRTLAHWHTGVFFTFPSAWLSLELNLIKEGRSLTYDRGQEPPRLARSRVFECHYYYTLTLTPILPMQSNRLAPFCSLLPVSPRVTISYSPYCLSGSKSGVVPL